MKRHSSLILTNLLLVSCFGFLSAETWHENLYLPGGSYWRKRVPVDVANETKSALEGRPMEIAVGNGNGKLPIAGSAVREIRVCDASGGEFLFQVLDASGGRITEGTVPAGARIAIPAECDAGTTRRYYIYFDNPEAWAVPDFFEGSAGVRNGGLEGGTDHPASWAFDRGDEQHKVHWVAEGAHGGKKCLKTVVAEGASHTWIAARQRNIAIIGGNRYRLEGWVRADGVKGKAGWYIHVGTAENQMMMGPVIDAGEGTFGWKKLRFDFTAPAESNLASLGTVLRGTGTAWHDDVTLESLESPDGSKVKVKVGALQSLELHVNASDAAWPSPEAGDPSPFRATVKVRNFTGNPIQKGLVQVSLRVLKAKLRGMFNEASLQVVAPSGETVPHFLMGNQLMFLGEAPPRSVNVYYIYCSETEAERPGPQQDYGDLVRGALNLARNPLFDEGERTPAEWEYGLEGDEQRKGLFSRSEGGKVGKHCASFTIPRDHPLGWVGWRQLVKARPNTRYWYSAWVRTKDITDGKIALHGHHRKEDGELCAERPYFSNPKSLTGTNDWTFLHTTVRTPADCANVQLHLTMKARGTLSHDGVLFCEVLPASLGRIESMSPGSGAVLAAWSVNPLVKVFRDTPPRAESVAIRLSAARNEKESIQLALRSRKELRNVRIKIDAPRNGKGQTAGDISINRVGFVPIDHPTSYYRTELPVWRRRYPQRPGRSDGWSDYWPDPLLPGGAFDLEAHTTQPIWITFSVPLAAAAGEYHGAIKITADGMEPKAMPLRLTVWDFSLDDKPGLTAILDLRNGRMGRFLNDDNRKTWLKFLADHRCSPGVLDRFIRFQYRDGKAILDTRKFDEVVSICIDDLHIRTLYTPWDFYCFGWAHPPKKFLGNAPFTPEYRRAYQACLKAFWAHLKQKGWEKNFILYISDEPHFREEGITDQMRRLVDMIHEAVPEILVYSSTWRHVPEWNGVLDIWGVGAYGCFPVDEMAARRKAGERLWFTTDGQLCTDTPLCAVERLYPYYCWKYGADAFEFWGVSWWTYDPFKFGWHPFISQSAKPGEQHWVRYPNGDGYLAYPGKLIGADGPISTIRLEQVREGMEDYEYFTILKKRIAAARKKGKDTAAADAALERVNALVSIPNAGGLRSTELLSDPNQIYEVRRSLAESIGLLRP